MYIKHTLQILFFLYPEPFAVELKNAYITSGIYIMQILWWWRGGEYPLGEKMKIREKDYKRGRKRENIA